MTIDVKIINILQATFSYDSVEHTFYVLTAVIFGESYNKKVEKKNPNEGEEVVFFERKEVV